MDQLWGSDFLSEPQPWPDYDYRKVFARSLYDYILDKDKKFPTVEPGWGPDMPLPPKVRSYFSDCVKQFVESLFDEMSTRHQPTHQFEEANYAMGRFLQQPYPNEDPFSSIVVTMQEDPAYDVLTDFNNQSPSTVGDPRRPIRELHRQGANEFFPTPYNSDVFARGTHGANLASQVENVTEIMSSRKSYVESFPQDGRLAPPPQITTTEPQKPGRSGGSALGRRQRVDSGEGSTSAGSNAVVRRIKTKRNQSSLRTAGGEVGQGSRNFGVNMRSVDESPRNTTGTRTVSKEGFKHECEQSHMETVTHAARQYRCEHCNAVFSRNSSLKRHQAAPTACKAKVQGENHSPPQSTSESGARDATFRNARPPSMASSSHGNLSPSIAGNQSVSSQNQYPQYAPASGPRASFAGGNHLKPMGRASSQQHRTLQPSAASRSPHRPSSLHSHSFINPMVLQATNSGYNDCD
ncbi:hypothetical protein L873DRAFT_446672 [Choiromyces venosus 120613-1]|uniref:C2H2-type domain-containing protein n=1 Tax=Choiromyces venosus 120613-1 TaxID=1336337 RepID=A0A3N4JYY4_9PEZI|nr:hypothetical protein L873DRAFT_446672 [Choiromyces venosus 120613-1]